MKKNFLILVCNLMFWSSVLLPPGRYCLVHAASPVAAKADVQTQVTGWLWRKGKSERFANQALLPGELVKWQLLSVNRGDKPAASIQFDCEISQYTRFQVGSITGTQSFAFSLDGQTFSSKPQVSTPQGWQPARVEDYRKVRLYLAALAPNAQWEATYTVAVR